jgi:hypothetical protein
MIGLLLAGFVIFVAVHWFIADEQMKRLCLLGAAVCVLIFIILLVLNVAGVATPVTLWPR